MIHPFDRDRSGTSLDAVIEQRRGRLTQDFRCARRPARLWFRLKARPVIGSDGEVIRIVGTLADVTDPRPPRSACSATRCTTTSPSLPNRQLFYDRLEGAHLREPGRQPAPDRGRDRPRQVQAGERVGRPFRGRFDPAHALPTARPPPAKPQDTLARVAGDEFAVILLSEREPDRIIGFAEMIRRAVTTPITYAEREIFLTGSIGLGLHDPQIASRREEV